MCVCTDCICNKGLKCGKSGRGVAECLPPVCVRVCVRECVCVSVCARVCVYECVCASVYV